MKLPLSAGICLRQRYLIQRLLGQGRWGYTYLALDQERFGERCILRQFHLPKIEKPERLEEIKIYFQQEVNRLYQLQHPCIPRFWATFMEAQELFIVQEFMTGFSCRQLLLSRRQQQQTVSETEVRFLLTTLLPCLDLLHQHHLAQGTIAPDAIVLKISLPPTAAPDLATPDLTAPNLATPDLAAPDLVAPDLAAAIPALQTITDITQTQPFLVTFGSFPAGLLRRLSESDRAANDLDIRYLRQTLLPIGRIGFMPPEQVHALKVHPHGDLYALAATCLVLLTGQDPEHLFDQATLTWRWPKAGMSSTLAAVLERMLAWQPVDRYQSAAAVLADLTASASVDAIASLPQPGVFPPLGAAVAVPAVNVLAPKLATSSTSLAPTPTRTEVPPASLADLAVPPSDEAVTLVYEPAAPARGWPMPLGRFFRRDVTRTQRPYLWPTLSLSIILSIGLLGVVSLVWVGSAKLLRLGGSPPGESRSVPLGRSGGLSTAALSPDQSPPWSSSRDTSLATPNGSAPLPLPTGPSPLPEATPSEEVYGGLARSLRFAPGEVSTLVRGNLEQAANQQYILEALQGQILAVQVVGVGAVMNLLRSNGQAIDAAAYRTQRWTGPLPADDRYQIEVSGYGAYTLEVALSPRTSQRTTPQAVWIRFAPGATTTTVTGEVAPGQVQRYLLAAQAQQLMVIEVLLGNVEVRTIAPNGQRLGTLVQAGHYGDMAHPRTWQTRLPQAGDYIIEVAAAQASRFALKFGVY